LSFDIEAKRTGLDLRWLRITLRFKKLRLGSFHADRFADLCGQPLTDCQSACVQLAAPGIAEAIVRRGIARRPDAEYAAEDRSRRPSYPHRCLAIAHRASWLRPAWLGAIVMFTRVFYAGESERCAIWLPLSGSVCVRCRKTRTMGV